MPVIYHASEDPRALAVMHWRDGFDIVAAQAEGETLQMPGSNAAVINVL
jgi:hypothetical protein